MKMTKKKVFAAALAVCLVAILSMSTLAWFSAQDTVKNEFFVADSTDTDKNDIFSVDVLERVDTDGNGVYDATLSSPNGFDYKDILPGDKLVKEPFVRNTGYYDQYIRVTVTISDATAWINALGLDFKIEDVFEGYDASKWTNISKAIEGETDTITYVLYYKDILDGDDTANDGQSGTTKDVTLFTHVNIPTTLTQEQAAAFKGNFAIDIKAEAVQTENVGANAFDAFATVGM
ncbi:MAG: hypothetical protein IJO04_05350 [Oscillospiraceae bacterium]|nr:hypothetical protein [Oscillospiraceae bacterium]